MTDRLYGRDLARIHAAGFGELATGAAAEIVRRLKSAAIQIHTVVDVGCGAGPVTAALAAAGFETIGVDSSAELLSLARVAVPEARLLHGSVYEIELPACEAIVAMGEPLAYHEPDVDADALISGFFKRTSEILPAGGLLIFDLIEAGEPVLTGRPWSSGDNWAVFADITEDTGARMLTRNIETFVKADGLYRRGREIHTLRIFDTIQICGLLNACGFATELGTAYGSQRLGPRRRAFFCTRR
jgi:SAM-dependent methyltransferase